MRRASGRAPSDSAGSWIEGDSEVGGGSFPGAKLRTWLAGFPDESLAERLRANDPPVIGARRGEPRAARCPHHLPRASRDSDRGDNVASVPSSSTATAPSSEDPGFLHEPEKVTLLAGGRRGDSAAETKPAIASSSSPTSRGSRRGRYHGSRLRGGARTPRRIARGARRTTLTAPTSARTIHCSAVPCECRKPGLKAVS